MEHSELNWIEEEEELYKWELMYRTAASNR